MDRSAISPRVRLVSRTGWCPEMLATTARAAARRSKLPARRVFPARYVSGQKRRAALYRGGTALPAAACKIRYVIQVSSSREEGAARRRRFCFARLGRRRLGPKSEQPTEKPAAPVCGLSRCGTREYCRWRPAEDLFLLDMLLQSLDHRSCRSGFVERSVKLISR